MPYDPQICFRISESELATLDRDVYASGLTRSKFLRNLVVNRDIQERPNPDLRKLYADIAEIQRDIQSYTASQAATPDALSQLTFALERIYRLLDERI